MTDHALTWQIARKTLFTCCHENVVAEAIWYWLAGNLTISVTQNYILNSGCQASAATLAKREKEYERIVEENLKQREAPGHDESQEERYYSVKQM